MFVKKQVILKMVYSLEERKELLEIYIQCNKNKSLARREYVRLFRERLPPSKNSFKNIYAKFRNTESLRDKKRERRRTKTGEDTELNALLYFAENPSKSSYAAAIELDISQRSVIKILHRHNFKPYSILPVQYLDDNNLQDRLTFCRDILDRIEEDDEFLSHVFWTDESSFSTAGIFNRKNAHYWAAENPHIVKKIKKQGYQTVNVWCGIHKDAIVGPVFINGPLNAQRYVDILQHPVENYLDNINLVDNRSVIWQQDGAPPHSARNVTEYLNRKYPIWIGRHGVIHWPAKSPDLTPMDFFLWGTIKQDIYETGVFNNMNELKECIRVKIEELNQNGDIFQRVRSNFIKRCQMCIQNGGGYVENI